MEKVMWLVLGGTAFVCALRAHQSRRALSAARWALGVLFLVFGAGVNLVYLLSDPDSYATFADTSPFAFVRDTWDTLVAPHPVPYISLLILGEAVAGLLLLAGGRWSRAGLIALIAFHVGQLAFGGVLWVWAPLMILTLGLLLRAERHWSAPVPGAPSRTVAPAH